VSSARPRDITPNEHQAGPDATAILIIDLGALAANYRQLRDLAGPAECAAVVKADAYGLGMAQAARALSKAGCKTFFVATLGEAKDLRDLLPDADIGFIGIARNEETHEPEPYVNKLPENIGERPVIVVDPMLATGGSLIHTLQPLVERGAQQPLTVVVALAAPEGIAAVDASGIDVTLFTAVIDDRLNDNAYIVPGLGDAGDRIYGTK